MDVETIEVLNDPRVDSIGTSASLVVNYCANSAANLGYTDDNCETDEAVIEEKMATWIVNTKTVGRYFDPVTYEGKIESMEYTRAVAKIGSLGRTTEKSNTVAQLDFKVRSTTSFSNMHSKFVAAPIVAADSVKTYEARLE